MPLVDFKIWRTELTDSLYREALDKYQLLLSQGEPDWYGDLLLDEGFQTIEDG